MTSTAAITQTESATLLDEACARNVSVEMHYEQVNSVLVTTRTRLLGCDDEHLLIERPQSAGKPAALRTRQQVTVYFLMGGKRYAFRTRIAKSMCSVSLNSQQRVAGMALIRPREIMQRQRRADFRMSMAAYPSATATGHRGEPDCGGRCAVDTEPFRARLVNISAGGIGLLLERAAASGWETGRVYFLAFTLPETADEIVMMAEARHCRPIPGQECSVAGFQFMDWAIADSHASERRITRFIAAEQRRQLKRARS